MRLNLNLKTTFIFLVAVFFMYQENIEAQPKKPKGKKTIVAVEIKPEIPVIAFTVSMSKPWTHLFEVEMSVKSSTLPEKSDLVMPVWTPGSYLVREYARHVQDFSAKDAAGNELIWQKSAKNIWTVDAKGAKEIRVSYKVYANELTVRTNELNDNHAFFTPAALLMHPKSQLATPSTVTVNPWKGWKIATGLPLVSEFTFAAENFDVLYDSPFEVGNFLETTFEVQGKKHRFVINGEGNFDMDKIAKDTAKIIEEAYKIFGELPYKDYTFILNLRGGGGLEHLNSTALQWNRWGFVGPRYTDFLLLVAHEYFHCFNVKRIRPDALGPFNYETENYTKLLWVAEGGTAYYENILVQRAGLISDKDFLAGRKDQMQALQQRPGRFETSLEDASFDAWIKFYRPDENAINNQISYYDKGELVNFLLDLEIRKASIGSKSLDDVLRYLYAEHYKKNKNYTPEDYQKISELMAGKSLNDFFAKYVRGTEEIDYNSILAGFGLEISTTNSNAKAQTYFGADFAQDGEKFTIRSIPAGTPAYNQGLNTGDQIIAIDGTRANQAFFTNYLSEKKAGDKVKLTIFRFDQLREIEITLGERIAPNFSIFAVKNPTEEQKALYRGYLGKDLK
jgi:predicted metalloprotease with PDZ domain